MIFWFLPKCFLHKFNQKLTAAELSQQPSMPKTLVRMIVVMIARMIVTMIVDVVVLEPVATNTLTAFLTLHFFNDLMFAGLSDLFTYVTILARK